MHRVRLLARAAITAAIASTSMAIVTVATAPAANAADQPRPGHTAVVPEKPRTNTPRINTGEIWDLEVVGNRVFVVGGFTQIQNNAANTTSYNQAYLAAYNLDTGLVDATFRPTFAGGQPNNVEASPDGTKLYVAGTFNTINGVAKKNVASLNLTTGAPIAGFTANANSQVDALDATDTTLYVGGRFATINNVAMRGLAAVNGTTGAVDTTFDNQLTGGIGVDGVLTVQTLKLTPSNQKLIVMHTARQIDGQDRYGVGMIDVATKQLLPWRTRLWEDNLQYVGGVQRLFAGDVSPDGSYFVVTSGSGGDRPPINDMAIAFSTSGNDNMEPLWNSRMFDSVYGVAITEKAVYIGGHFVFQESQTAPDPWPGLATQGYGVGQGIGAYVFRHEVVRRDHLGALDPANGKALEWHPSSTSVEGVKAIKATPRGLFVGGDGQFQGGVRTGRVAFYDLNTAEAPTTTDTRITNPVQGRVEAAGDTFTIDGVATSPSTIRRVQVELIDSANRYLQDDLVSWSGTSNNILATLGTRSGNSTPWSLDVMVPDARAFKVQAKAYGTGSTDPTKAVKKMETFVYDNTAPTARITSPARGLVNTTSFTMSGTATDDQGVSSLQVYIRDANDNYLTANGQLVDEYTTYGVDPDVVGATSTTWSTEVTLPHEGVWTAGVLATDITGQSGLTWFPNVDWTVDSSGAAPTVTIASPLAVTPPTTAPALTVAPGSPITFSGNAADANGVKTVEIRLQNTTTRENLSSDGSWGTGVVAGFYKVSPNNLNQASYNWSYTTPFNLSPGTYTFSVRATDTQDLTTSNTLQGRLTVNAAVPGDAAPNGLLGFTGTDQTPSTLQFNLAGTATDNLGVASVRVAIQDSDTGRYLQPNGTLAAGFATVNASLGTPNATTTTFALPVTVPQQGNYGVTAFAVDTAGQWDTSTTGATARYLVYPGDADPYLNETLRQPTTGASFTQSRIVFTGRSEDDVSMGRVEIAVVNAAGQYMATNGTFTSTTESFVRAFLNSPGSPGSNYSYTTPIIPAGTYTVRVRPVDAYGQFPATTDSTVTVAAPAGNQAPVASVSRTCTQNSCVFDARATTDENAPTVTYAWNFGNGTTGTGPLPTRIFSTPGTFTVTVTATDEYGATGTATTTVAITEPPGNAAPTAVFPQPTCVGLVCAVSGAASTDPNTGDTLTYTFAWGDGTANGTTSAGNHTYASAGTYPITMTVTDGWGDAAAPVTRTVTVAP